MEVVSTLHDIKGNIKRSINFPENNQEKFQLDEFEFYKSFKEENSGSLYQSIKNILLFIVSVSVTTALVMTFLVWVVSGIKQNYYFQQVYSAVDEHTPPPLRLDDHSGHLPTPIEKTDLSEEISSLVRGLEKLMEIVINLHKDYQTGGITDSHYAFLIQNVDIAKSDLSTGFYRRLRVFFG